MLMNHRRLGPIVFASKNRGKLGEVRRVAESLGIEVSCPTDCADSPVVEECGRNYLDNAALKANAYFLWTGVASLGDDSGLEVTILGEGPGVYSARFAGEAASDADNRAKMLLEMRGLTDRSARYRSVLYLRLNEHEVFTAEGTLEGTITLGERGAGGFGYDSIFEVAGYGATLAELKERGVAVKTHRILALEILFAQLRSGAVPRREPLQRRC